MLARSIKRNVIIMSFVVVGMFGFGFAMVPLYNVLCNAVGLNGKSGGATSYGATKVDTKRDITVEFLATNNNNLPWDFYPMDTKFRLHPGEQRKTAYFAKNNTDHTMVIQAIPSVAPGEAAKYLKKTECFCFTRHTFKAGEGQEMPMLFYIDPKLPKKIKTVTISYTLFDVSHFKPRKNNNASRIS